MGCPISLSLSFYVIIFNVSSWLIRGSNKSKGGYDRVHWLFVFLRMPSPSFCVRSKFWFKWKWGSLSRLSAIPVYLVLDITRLPCTHVESDWTLTTIGPLEFCAAGLPKCCMWSRRQDTQIHCAHRLCSCACSLSPCTWLTNPRSKIKLGKKSQNGDSGALNPAQSAPECGTLCDNTGRATVNLPYGFFP